jgi:cellulose synthase/poly-beta-1,6-N-acetylglucosamine synthase-like glycosyltransferase
MVNNMILLQIPFYLGLGYLVLVVAWLVLLTAASWLFRARTLPDAPLLRLGVVIPAHNEESGIGPTIESIRKCDYPIDLLKIIVIADNCGDATAEVAKAAGVCTLVRDCPLQRGKGQALDWFLTYEKEHYHDLDGLCFVDADVVCDKRLFRELSASLSCPGVEVVQGFNGVANSTVNWRTALVTAAFNVFNHLRMAGNDKLFGTAMLKGLGMAFATPVLARFGWPAHSEVEDVEFSLLLLEHDIAIHYNPAAIITSEMATTDKQANMQRQRWEGGRFRLAARMLPGLIGKVLHGRFRYLHAVADFLVPPLSLLVCLLLSWLVFAHFLVPAAQPVLLMLTAGLVCYVVSGQLQRRMDWRLWLYLAAAPLFVLWKLAVYGRIFLEGGSAGWTRTLRSTELHKK